MKKVIRLTENELVTMVKRIIKEDSTSMENESYNPYGFKKIFYPNPDLLSDMENDRKLRSKNFSSDVKISIKNITKGMSKAYYKSWMDSKDITLDGFEDHLSDKTYKFDGFWRKSQEIGEHIAFLDMYGQRMHLYKDGKIFIEGIFGYSGWEFKEFKGNVYIYIF